MSDKHDTKGILQKNTTHIQVHNLKEYYALQVHKHTNTFRLTTTLK